MTPPQKTSYTPHTRLLEKSIVSWSRRIHTNDFRLIMISLIKIRIIDNGIVG